jgi:hypothetical protein
LRRYRFATMTASPPRPVRLLGRRPRLGHPRVIWAAPSFPRPRPGRAPGTLNLRPPFTDRGGSKFPGAESREAPPEESRGPRDRFQARDSPGEAEAVGRSASGEETGRNYWSPSGAGAVLGVPRSSPIFGDRMGWPFSNAVEVLLAACLRESYGGNRHNSPFLGRVPWGASTTTKPCTGMD